MLVGLFSILTDRNTDRKAGGFRAATASDTVGARGPGHAPGAIVGVARVTRSLRGALRMEASLLVERDGMRGV